MRLFGSSLLILFLVACASARQRPVDSPESTKVMHRAFEHTHAQHMLFCYIPAHPDFAKDAGNMAKMIGYTAKRHEPLVIYSPDPEVATRMMTIAFATIASNALRGVTVVAAIGEKNDSYVRPVIEKTGAKLYVDVLP